MLIIDVEVYRDYFLFESLDTATGRIQAVDFYPGQTLNVDLIRNTMKSNTTIGFNTLSYDIPVITCALKGWTTEQLKTLSDEIIESQSIWQVLRSNDIQLPNWDHIDLIEVAPGQCSLKIYGGRLKAPKMQDLPIEPSASISPEDRMVIKNYCANDLETTLLLFKSLRPQIELRKAMSDQYGVDLRSKSDAQIAEAVIKSELEASVVGKKYYAPTLSDNYTFQYKDPEFILFKDRELKKVFKKITDEWFTLAKNGSVKMPEWLANQRIRIGQSEYQMGIGGLHSCEKSQYIEADDNHLLLDMDVASYYPSIILKQKLAPSAIGEPFLDIYQGIVDRRLKAKASGDKVTAETLKICVNGTYGKLGSKYSILYSPELLLQTTLTGQLALLMLIERLEVANIRVVSANTDGIVVLCPKTLEDDLEKITWAWMLRTSYVLERSDYRCIASRDVNSYVAVKLDGKTKGKGIFAPASLAKNPDGPIIYKALSEYISTSYPIDKTIRECTDIAEFCTVRRVTGGAVWQGDLIGKSIRFYHSTDGSEITYAKNGNKVPLSEGCRPLMDLPSQFPNDVDYDYYLGKAHQLLTDVGYARKPD